MARDESKRRTRPTLMNSANMLPLGAAYAIRIGQGDYGACRVLETRTLEQSAEHFDEYVVFVAATAWRGDAPPAPSNPALRTLLLRDNGDVCGVWIGELPPREFERIGIVEPTATDRRMVGRSYSGWELLTGEIQRRLPRGSDADTVSKRSASSDPDAFDVHSPRPDPKTVAADPISTFRELARQRPLEEWEEHQPQGRVHETETILQDAVRGLIALGSTARLDAKLALIRQCIERLNRLNAEGPFILTIEREDLCEYLYRLLDLCGAEDAEEFVDTYRDW